MYNHSYQSFFDTFERLSVKPKWLVFYKGIVVYGWKLKPIYTKHRVRFFWEMNLLYLFLRKTFYVITRPLEIVDIKVRYKTRNIKIDMTRCDAMRRYDFYSKDSRWLYEFWTEFLRFQNKRPNIWRNTIFPGIYGLQIHFWNSSALHILWNRQESHYFQCSWHVIASMIIA